VVLCLGLVLFGCSMFLVVVLLCLVVRFLCFVFVLCRILFRLCLFGFVVLVCSMMLCCAVPVFRICIVQNPVSFVFIWFCSIGM